MAKILIVEDDVAFCQMLETFLTKKNYQVNVSHTGNDALAKIKNNSYQIVLTDVRLPDKDGNEILQFLKENHPATKVILMTGYAEVNLAVDAIKTGAFDYISKPINPEKMLQVVKSALETEEDQVIDKPTKSKKETAKRDVEGSYVAGVSDASKKLSDYIKLVAPTNMSVLIIGDSGTGKEYIAKNIHDQSKRAKETFIAVDCGAIPKEIASSEFFGHIKGSFTGAVNNKTGHFQAANGGTLFLDEIGNLNYELQVQLLRALQERKIKPVGSNQEINVDIRVIAATNEDLKKAVENGDFREDLYHRLNEFSIQVPALRKRKDDLMLFADHFLEKANEELERDVVGFSDEALELLHSYSWPGNLREMQNTIKRSVLLTTGKIIDVDALPMQMQTETKEEESYSLFKNKNEQELILDALEQANGNKSKAARILSIDRKTLYNKLKQYDIKL
ncbi:sigma-54 dependent transcriptional regulator [Mesonia sp.]|uniref:sigma-54-dependent transcriptional regulator n=1 Tax=Mesonia sp. TaxID=1960830 RepID=UPI0017652549|nr:sigma-54 dependent transcriptional regulator [Mesonia sp.]HIB36633.1 sigma-54-dependent Fis family transcriptional regulator [Mesonia sp.]HIO25873.1 sigma-54-dependent Fis family transcriptional regulator [Flavobacteriaceae bacterium]